MLIQCTKKLLDRLKVQPQPRIEENPLFFMACQSDYDESSADCYFNE